ncbi:hypothetical protein HK096_003169 [Nowakowskiella sp. JEL0078]|nr:hypothetical protein HK096_003169 [Nowakowskiella sp. JEL0078]
MYANFWRIMIVVAGFFEVTEKSQRGLNQIQTTEKYAEYSNAVKRITGLREGIEKYLLYFQPQLDINDVGVNETGDVKPAQKFIGSFPPTNERPTAKMHRKRQ